MTKTDRVVLFALTVLLVIYAGALGYTIGQENGSSFCREIMRHEVRMSICLTGERCTEGQVRIFDDHIYTWTGKNWERL